MLSIKGFVKTTLVDYPGKVACTVFLPKCNFGCGFCHNKDLVLNPDKIKAVSEQEVLDYLKEKKQWIDGIVVTGGEPLLHKELSGFLAKVKELGYLVKLDTNGTDPSFLKELLDKKLVDFVAMDVKNCIERYDETARAPVDMEKIKESISLIKDCKDHEYRTTVVPGLHTEEDIKKIGEWLKGSKKFSIQNFRADDNVIEEKYKAMKSFSKEELGKFKKILENYVGEVEVRG